MNSGNWRRLNDRGKLGYKGPVAAVTIEWRGPYGTSVEELTFDRDGARLCPPGPAVLVTPVEGGGSVDAQQLARNGSWTMSGLHGVNFPAHGAVRAETTFDAQSFPRKTVFLNEQNRVLAYVRYTCDKQGLIKQASQYICSPQTPGQLLATNFDAISDKEAAKRGDPEFADLSFKYDDEGRLLEQSLSIAGIPGPTTIHAYNDHGDISMTQGGAEEPFLFDYEYDLHDNWTLQTVRHSSGDATFHRRIVYFAGA